MKKTVYFLLLLMPVLFLSCQEDFDPKTGIEEKYVLFGVFDAGYNPTYLKEVHLSRVYNIDGYDLSNYSVAPVLNAEVAVTSRGRVRYFCESQTRSSSGSVYVDTGFGNVWANPGDAIDIMVKLKNGKTLSAKTYALHWNYLDFSYLLDNGFTTQVNYFLWGKSFDVSWYNNKTSNLFFPSLSLFYSEVNDSSEVYYTKDIPTSYIKRNGQREPVYPSYQYQKSISYDYAAIDSLLAGLSHGKTKKIKLYWLTVKLLEFNSDLSNYYSSIHGFTDRFSIRLDDKVYTNINGGIGVLGAMTRYEKNIYFNRAFGEVFGYDIYTDW